MPQSVQVDHVPHYNNHNPKNAIKETIDALDKLIETNGNVYCGLTIELIQGEAGFIFGTKEYYKAICEWSKKHGIYIWIDEVQSFARTTEILAYQMFELDDYVDVVTIGKVLQGAGTFYTEELNPKAGLIAGTFNGSIASLNAAKATVRYLREGNFYGEKGRIKDLENKFKAKFSELASGSCKGLIPYYGGIGTMLSFEVGDGSLETTNKFMKKLFENGIISFSAGKEPTRVRFLLPLPLLDEHIDQIFSIVEKTILETIK